MWLAEPSCSKTASIISKVIVDIISVSMHVKHMDGTYYLSWGWSKYISQYRTCGTSANENGAAYEDDGFPSSNAG